MLELLEQSLLPFNLPLTIALGVIVLFWLVVLLGFFGIDTFDMDLTPEVLDADTFSLPDLIGKLTNAADIPVTIIVSLYVFFLWAVSILGNFYFNPGQSNLIGLAVLGSGLVLALALTKTITHPLVPMMRRMKNAEKAPPVIGQSGIVSSLEVDATFGQVLVEREGGAPALLICKTSDGLPPIPRGTEVLVIAHDDDANRYIVRTITAGHDPLLSEPAPLPQTAPPLQGSTTEKELS